MRKSIWKYEFHTCDEFKVTMPEGAEIVAVQMQGDSPCMWAIVNQEAVNSETRSFRIYGTGHLMGDFRQNYIGTYQEMNGALVFHLFEKKSN